MITESGWLRSATDPRIILFFEGAPTRLESSKPIMMATRKVPSSALARGCALKRRTAPENSWNTAHAIEIVFRKRLDFVHIKSLFVHHPDVCVGYIEDLTGGALHDPSKNRGLVFQKKGRKGDREDQTDIFRPVA